MSLNPPLVVDQNGKLAPLLEKSETLVFTTEYEYAHMHIALQNGTFKGTGQVFVTTHRMVFVKKGDPATHKKITSVEMPLCCIANLKQQEGMWRTYYLCGTLQGALPESKPAKFWIKAECDTLYTLLTVVSDLQKKEHNSALSVHPIPTSMTEDVVYVDPSDPSILFIPTGAPQ